MLARLGLLLMRRLASKAAAEAVGTFVMVFTGCGAVAVGAAFPGAVPAGAVPVVFGLAVAAMIYAVGHVSGAHFNPAVTLAFAIARRFPIRELPYYWVAQFAGAALAVCALACLLPEASDFGAVVPHVAATRALGWEIVVTFILMFVIIAVATDARAIGTMAGAAIGAAVMVGAFVGGPVTGAAMNPARALAPALVQSRFDGLWIYFAGPFLGAALAALAYEWIRCEPTSECVPANPEKNAKGCC